MHLIFPFAAFFLFCWIFVYDGKQLKIKADGVSKFIAFLVLAFLIKMCLLNGKYLPTNSYNLEMRKFLLVFLEDVFFVMLPFYICQKINNKYLKFVIWTYFSVCFGMGHMYQGMFAVFVTAIYPYFISRYYAMKTSFGTVMVCHFIYDCFTFLFPRFNNLMVAMKEFYV
jgi:hypothetical protein